MGTGPSWDQFSSPSIRQPTKALSHCSTRPCATLAAILAARNTAGDPWGHLTPGSPSPRTQQLCLQTQALPREGTSTRSLGSQETHPCTSRPARRLWGSPSYPKSPAGPLAQGTREPSAAP